MLSATRNRSRVGLFATARWAWLLLLVMTLWAPHAGGGVEAARFEIRSARAQLNDGVYYVDGRVQYRLSQEAMEALESGVPLTIELQLEVNRLRRLWFATNVATLSQRYQLQYRPLSDNYLVRNLNSGEEQSFSSPFSALTEIGRIESLPMIDAALLDDDSRYEVRMRAVLDTREFPGPLRLLAFWADGWRIASDWHAWRLEL